MVIFLYTENNRVICFTWVLNFTTLKWIPGVLHKQKKSLVTVTKGRCQ